MLKAKNLSNTNAERLQLSDPVIEIVSSDSSGVNSEATSAFKLDTDPHYLSAFFLLPVSYFPTPHAIQTTLICTNGKKTTKTTNRWLDRRQNVQVTSSQRKDLTHNDIIFFFFFHVK